MKSSKNKKAPHILLFWYLPSISKVHEYKLKSDTLNEAVVHLKSVKVITYRDEVLQLENVGIDSGRFFGLKQFKGKMKKILLNINTIKMVILL
jgi:hypothetical protein